LAAARAVIFAQMVNDPGYERQHGRGVNKEAAALERERLFKIIEELVKWENTSNEHVLEQAREEIRKSWRETCRLNRDHPRAKELFDPDKLPAFHDPFAGGGALPLEAQRLGLETYASDLNPVAVLINKAMIEIPPLFANRPPVNPQARQDKGLFDKEWRGANGLAADVQYYGQWMRDEAEKRIGHLYPKIEITPEIAAERPDLKPYIGRKLTVIAWLWARTVKSPNPAFAAVDVPLASTFMLSSKAGKEAYVEPVIENGNYRFTVKLGKPKDASEAQRGTKSGSSGSSFLCLMSQSPMTFEYLRTEAKAGRMRTKLMAIVADGDRGRVYLPPTAEMEAVAQRANPTDPPATELPAKALGFRVQEYGMKQWRDLFTPRQLVALTTLSDLVQETRERVRQDSLGAGLTDDNEPLRNGGTAAAAYAEAVALYLALAVDRCCDFSNTCTRWVPGNQKVMNLFGKQAIAMTWDFPEAAILHETVGGFVPAANFVAECILKVPQFGVGSASQQDAMSNQLSCGKVVSTDPPYYDNIGYADLSDFFYVWLRRSLKSIFPDLFATLAVPKTDELVATPFRHGNKEKAESFFLEGMTQAMHRLSEQTHPAFPVTIYYAFKQAESDDQGTASTGWDTFLAAVIKAGFAITGTWPMRSEQEHRMVGMGTNALASSIVLVCRPRAVDAPAISRREFIRELNEVLPVAFDEMTRGGLNSPVAPVDLSQAIIGPGMAIYSKYSAVLEADGSRMSVRAALQIINRFLAEDDFDHDTQFCLHWFENSGWSEGKFGDADVLARAKGTSVEGVSQSGVLVSSKGSVRLIRWPDYPTDWTPEGDQRTPVWEALHQLIRALQHEGESAAGSLLAKMPTRGESARQLAYRLYTLCERKGWAEDARAYNELITSWNAIDSASHEVGHVGSQTQIEM